jgi:hypothetical protein
MWKHASRADEASRQIWAAAQIEPCEQDATVLPEGNGTQLVVPNRLFA